MTPKLIGSDAAKPLGCVAVTSLGPLEAAAVLRSAKERLHNDIATLLDAFTADTGLRVSGVGVYAQPQYLDPTAPSTTLLSPPPTDLDPTRPYRYTVSSVVDV